MNFSDIISWASGAIDSTSAALVAWVSAGFNTLFGDVSAVDSFAGALGDAIAAIFSHLWTWLQSMWQWVYTNIVQKLASLIQRLHDYLKKIFGPLLDQIRGIIAAYKALWNQYVKPIYDFLQRLRRALVIFRLLGFKWAKALDDKIQQMENAITAGFLNTLKNLNLLANWINYILDPLGLFQPSVWLNSIAQSIGAIFGITYGAMNDPGFTSNSLQYSVAPGYYDSSTMAARFNLRNRTGPLPEDQQIMNSYRAEVSNMGYSK